MRDGKVRYVGGSNYGGWQLMKALAVADRHGYERFVTQQIYYSLQSRDAEYELVPIAVDQGVGIIVWSPLAGGLLSGKYRRGVEPPAGSRQLTDWNEPPVRDQEQLYDVVEALVEIGEGHGVSAAQVALAWLLDRPGVVSLIVGARTDEQLADNLGAVDLKLSDGERDAARGAEPAAADLSVLAPGQDGEGPARTGGPRAAAAVPLELGEAGPAGLDREPLQRAHLRVGAADAVGDPPVDLQLASGRRRAVIDPRRSPSKKRMCGLNGTIGP